MGREAYKTNALYNLRKHIILLTLQPNSFPTRATILDSPVSEEWRAEMYWGQMWRQVFPEYDWCSTTASPLTHRASNLMPPDTPLLPCRLQYSVDQNKTTISLARNQTNLNIHGALPLLSRFLCPVTSHHELFGWEEMTSSRNLRSVSTQMNK
jgi:hypothetical protein